MSCHASVCFDCCVFTVSPPPFTSGRPCCCRRLHRCRVRLRRRRQYPYRRASRQAEPLPLSLISSIYLYLSIVLGIVAADRYIPILMHSLFLSPLVIPAFILLQPVIYIIH